MGTLYSPRVSAGVDFRRVPLSTSFFEGLGTRSDAGILITPETALTIGVVFRAVNVLAHAVATVPLVIYRREDESTKARDNSHPQYRLLHDEPNSWMTSFQFRHLMVSRMILWGNFYAQILPGIGGVSALVPLDPDPNVTRVIDQLGDGRLVYETKFRDSRGVFGRPVSILQDEMLHVRGFSRDGKVGVPLTSFARNAMGLALAAEKHGSMFMKRGAILSGILSSDNVTNPETREKNEAAWNRAYGGHRGSGGVPLLEGGWKFQQMTATNRDSQWLESRDFSTAELGPRFLGVPGLLCGYPDKTATYASAQQMREVFVQTGVMPLTDNIRAELTRSVVTGEDSYADFVLEGLLRGDIKTRYDAHRVAVMTGWKSRNEVREIEGDNPGPPELDQFFEPLNLGIAGEETDPQANQRRPPASPADGGGGEDGEENAEEPPDGQASRVARMREIVRGVAVSVARKEVAAIAGSGRQLGAARRFASDPKGWKAWLQEFYDQHARVVSERMRVPWDIAEGYCLAQRQRLAGGVAEIEGLEAMATTELLALTVGV